MNIRLEHTSNPLNYGTNMMVTNFMYYLDKEMNTKNNYLLDVVNDFDADNYKNQYIDGNIQKQLVDYDFTFSHSLINRGINKIKRELFNKYAIRALIKGFIKNIDSLIILGGDDLSEYYSIESLKKEFYRLNYIKKKIGILLVGQTIGPFKKERIKLAGGTFENIKIYSRDPWTTQYLSEVINVKNVKESSDLAFLPLPNQDNLNMKDQLLRKYNLFSEKYITLIPSGLYQSYCKNIDKYLENWIKIIKVIRNKFPNINIILLPHVLRSKDVDDRNIIKKIEEIMANDKNIKYIYEEMAPVQARIILGNGLFTITGRMHGAISTFQMGKPAISISYSVKYKGVIGEGLGLEELIVDGSKEEEWISNNVVQEVSKKIDFLSENYNSLIEQIHVNIDEAEIKVLDMISDIASILKQSKGQ